MNLTPGMESPLKSTTHEASSNEDVLSFKHKGEIVKCVGGFEKKVLFQQYGYFFCIDSKGVATAVKISNQKELLVSNEDLTAPFSLQTSLVLPESLFRDSLNSGEYLGIAVINNYAEPYVIAGKIMPIIRDGRQMFEITDDEGHFSVLDIVIIDSLVLVSGFSKVDFPKTLKSSASLNFYEHGRSEYLSQIKNVVEAGLFYDDPNLYKFLTETWSNNLSLLIKYTYRGLGEDFKVNEVIKSCINILGEEKLSILLDPWIFQNWASITPLLIESSSRDMDIVHLRGLIRVSQPALTVYRCMMLNDQELKDIKAKGILAPGMLLPSSVNLLKDYFSLYPEMSLLSESGILGQFKRKLITKEDKTKSLFCSASQYPDVANSVGHHASRQIGVGKKLFEFTCNLNETRVIRQRGIFDTRFRKKGTLKIGDIVYDESVDDGIEMFIPFNIRPNEIKNVRLIEEIPPMWIRD